MWSGGRSAALSIRVAEVSGGDFLAAFLSVVAFAVGHLACLFDSMHQYLFRVRHSPLIRQHCDQVCFRQLTGQRYSELTKSGPGEI